MALNKEVFKTRSLTAVVFAAVMLAGLFWNYWSFVILFTIIHFGCWYEFIKLMKKIYAEKYLPYCLWGLVYITMPALMMLDLWQRPMVMKGQVTNTLFTYILPSAIIFSIWINDTMAYIVGSFIGKTPFSKISPKKTWEGTLGGIILCVLVIGFLFPLIFPATFHSSNSLWFAIAAICAVFGTLGDLLESKLKRMAGVKDSGSILPGHGGFLDRFDSMLVATPFVWLYVQIMV